MKKYVSLLLLVPMLSFAQDVEKAYRSKEKEEYHNDWVNNYKPWEPMDINEIQAYKNPFFEVKEMKKYTPYKGSEEHQKYYHKSLTSKFKASPELASKVDNKQIVKYEKKGLMEAIVYKRYEYPFANEASIDVAYSNNGGESWTFYYTGITHGQPLCLKSRSKTPLFNEQGDLQLEACLLRQISQPTRGYPLDYELVKDGLLLTIDLESLRKDSDGDGMTDIVETWYMTDSYDIDTDGDGITDDLDMNPRRSGLRSDKTAIFEHLINYEFTDTLLTIAPDVCYTSETTRTVMIVTDNADIYAVQPKSNRIIMLSAEEYENMRKYYQPMRKMNVSPLFKVDEEEESYLVSIADDSGIWEFVVKKIDDGWKMDVVAIGIF